MILASGAIGNVGGELVRQLAANGRPFRGLVHDPESDTTLPAGVEAASGDLDAPESLRGALTDVEAVFFLPGYRDMPGLAAEARRAGAKRVVQLSGSSAAVPGAGGDQPLHGRLRSGHPRRRAAVDDGAPERVHVQLLPVEGAARPW